MPAGVSSDNLLKGQGTGKEGGAKPQPSALLRMATPEALELGGGGVEWVEAENARIMVRKRSH
jgi:hypothetical protein